MLCLDVSDTYEHPCHPLSARCMHHVRQVEFCGDLQVGDLWSIGHRIPGSQDELARQAWTLRNGKLKHHGSAPDSPISASPIASVQQPKHGFPDAAAIRAQKTGHPGPASDDDADDPASQTATPTSTQDPKPGGDHLHGPPSNDKGTLVPSAADSVGQADNAVVPARGPSSQPPHENLPTAATAETSQSSAGAQQQGTEAPGERASFENSAADSPGGSNVYGPSKQQSASHGAAAEQAPGASHPKSSSDLSISPGAHQDPRAHQQAQSHVDDVAAAADDAPAAGLKKAAQVRQADDHPCSSAGPEHHADERRHLPEHSHSSSRPKQGKSSHSSFGQPRARQNPVSPSGSSSPSQEQLSGNVQPEVHLRGVSHSGHSRPSQQQPTDLPAGSMSESPTHAWVHTGRISQTSRPKHHPSNPSPASSLRPAGDAAPGSSENSAGYSPNATQAPLENQPKAPRSTLAGKCDQSKMMREGQPRNADLARYAGDHSSLTSNGSSSVMPHQHLTNDSISGNETHGHRHSVEAACKQPGQAGSGSADEPGSELASACHAIQMLHITSPFMHSLDSLSLEPDNNASDGGVVVPSIHGPNAITSVGLSGSLAKLQLRQNSFAGTGADYTPTLPAASPVPSSVSSAEKMLRSDPQNGTSGLHGSLLWQAAGQPLEDLISTLRLQRNAQVGYHVAQLLALGA